MTGADRTPGVWAPRLAPACGWIAVVLGALVLAGWATDSVLLKQLDADLPELKANAAVALIALGLSLVLLAPPDLTRGRRLAGIALAGLAAAIGLAILFEYAFGSIGIDELLFDDSGAYPGRPAPVGAAAIVIGALAAATLDAGPPRYRLTLTLQAIGAAVTLSALVGFAYDVDYLRGRAATTGVALHGALALAIVLAGLALARPDRGVVAFLSGDDPASTFARRVAPVAILVPLILGGLRLAGESSGLFGDDLGLAIVTLGSMAILLAVIAISVRDLRVQSARGDVGERSFRAVTETSIESIVTADERGRILYLNPAAVTLFGYEPEELIGESVGLLMPDRYRERHEAGMRRFLETGEARIIGATVELEGRRRDGSEFPLSISLSDWEAEAGTRFTATMNDITERRRSQEATRELAAIVEGSTEAVIAWTLDGRVRSWNRGAERIYGYPPEEMLGRGHEVLMPPGQRSDLPMLLDRIRGGDAVENFEAVRMRKDGRLIDVAVTASPVLDEGGRMVAASTITRDISEQKAAERRLAEAARHFELIPDLVATCGFDGYFKLLNGAWEQMLGWTPEELLPNPFLDIVHPEDRASVDREVARQAQGATTAEFQIRVATKDGGYRWTEWSASPDLPSGVFHCVGREITERIEVERALAAERRQLADAQQLASVGSWELDVVTGARTWSAQQFRNHGFDPADEVPSFEEVLDRIHPDDQVVVLARLAELEAGEFEFEYGYRVILPGGEVREMVTEGRPFRDPDGRIRVMGTTRDVTAERAAERLKDDFFGLVSHELRTPLTSIIGYTELLSEIEAERLSEQGRRFVEVIERNSRRELSLVGDLLLLTKITAGTFEIEVGRADLGAIARAAAESARPEAAGAGIEVEAEADAGPVIDGDPHRLAQVADNLISNAIKFTPHGGRVVIRAVADGARATLAVSDTGIGIPPEDCDRLFERMFRAPDAERLHIQGTGLGLTIVKAIVDAHGGTIAVDSDLGRGTTVAVSLPLAIDRAGPREESPLAIENE